MPKPTVTVWMEEGVHSAIFAQQAVVGVFKLPLITYLCCVIGLPPVHPNVHSTQKGRLLMSSITSTQVVSLSTQAPRPLPVWRRWLRKIEWRLLLLPLIGLLLWQGWALLAESNYYADFIVPHPDTVWARLEERWADGSLVTHVAVTLREALSGLFIASLIATALGYIIARVKIFDYLLTPYLIFLQAIPVIAISPLIIIWFGSGLASKVVIAAMITWFPMMIATIVGIRNVSPNLREMMRANAASRWQIFRHLEVPSAMPELLGGLKIAVTLSVVGAAVGEFVSAREGLGYLVMYGRGISDTPTVVLAVLMLTVVSLVLYSLVAMLETSLLSWRKAGKP
ncbi:MAG: ABC transporter permease [Anaerolineae bacterium]|nr:ABC transporter permease [Anaerolineae bacterium]